MVKRMIVKIDEKNALAARNVSHPAPRVLLKSSMEKRRFYLKNDVTAWVSVVASVPRIQFQLKKDIQLSLIEKKQKFKQRKKYIYPPFFLRNRRKHKLPPVSQTQKGKSLGLYSFPSKANPWVIFIQIWSPKLRLWINFSYYPFSLSLSPDLKTQVLLYLRISSPSTMIWPIIYSQVLFCFSPLLAQATCSEHILCKKYMWVS